jgi:sarcosine oxidase
METTRRTATKMLAAAALTPMVGTAAINRSSPPVWDVAVVGAGAFGAWTAYALRQLGVRVCLVDAFGPGNSRSSSGGESRITRCSYGTQEIYTRWAAESLAAWKELQKRSATRIVENTGVLAIVPAGDAFLDQSAMVMQRLGLRYERMSAAETMHRFPSFHLDSTESALFEPDSGALMARRSIQVLVTELVSKGVTYKAGAIKPPTGSGGLTKIDTVSGESISAGQYIFACGPWLPKVFPNLLQDRIRSDRAEVFFLGVPAGDTNYEPPSMPTWMDDYGVGGAYGFPSLDGRGCKIAVDSIVAPLDPDTGDRTVTAPYIWAMRQFVRRRFPGLSEAPIIETRVCQYEMTGDENYILDRHPEFNNVWIAGGGSGHGFKCAPNVGRYMAQLIMGEGSKNPLFSITKPLQQQET